MTLFDENADVLRGMEDRGVDLAIERTVDFSHIFENQSDAIGFIRTCAEEGYEAEDTTDDEMRHIDVTVSKTMIPSCPNITEVEVLLGKLAARHNGRTDGWGFCSD